MSQLEEIFKAALAEVTNERDALRAELAAAKEERDRLAAHVERLRQAMEEALPSLCYSGWPDGIKSALAATPAQSLAAHDAAVKVAVLREVANKFEATEIDSETREPSESYDCGYKDGQYSAVNRMIAEADRIAKEAPHA